MTESNVVKTASIVNDMVDPHDDIDENVLDSAFEEFDKGRKRVKDLKTSVSVVSEKSPADKDKPCSSQNPPSSSSLPEELWSDEYFKKLTEDLQKNMASAGDIDPSQLDSMLEQMMNNVDLPEFDRAMAGNNKDDQSMEEQLRVTVEEITKGLQDLPMHNLMKGAGDGESEEGGANMLPFLEDIMQQFLSKDVLYPVFSETCKKYPDWLKKNQAKLKDLEHEKYTKQYEIMKKVVTEFDKESDSDSAEVKKARFNTILGLLQEMQEYGSPPKDLVGEDVFPGDLATPATSDGMLKSLSSFLWLEKKK